MQKQQRSHHSNNGDVRDQVTYWQCSGFWALLLSVALFFEHCCTVEHHDVVSQTLRQLLLLVVMAVLP